MPAGAATMCRTLMEPDTRRPVLKALPFALAFAAGASLAADNVVKIGSASPVSGPSAHLGKDTENGARMAIDDLNAAGFAVDGKPVKLVLQAEDDGGDPKQGT